MGTAHRQAWLECEGSGTPPNPMFDPMQVQRFRVSMQAEADRINGIVR